MIYSFHISAWNLNFRASYIFHDSPWSSAPNRRWCQYQTSLLKWGRHSQLCNEISNIFTFKCQNITLRTCVFLNAHINGKTLRDPCLLTERISFVLFAFWEHWQGEKGRLRGLQHQTSSFCVINSLRWLDPCVSEEEEGSPMQSRATSVSRCEALQRIDEKNLISRMVR